MNTLKPFEELKNAEALLEQYKVTDNPEVNYRQLVSLLTQERVLDSARIPMFEQHKHGSEKAKDYVFREYMVRHKISEYALSLDKEVTDRILDNDLVETSVVVMCIKNRELYPKPVKKS
ncbi:hypothetical protein KC992_00330 [Candidatus Saccharibacteria bacterium]|nr:hypothetical protein [Candidatus Saccharibacteria bacterium]